jgi:hypothetical protein
MNDTEVFLIILGSILFVILSGYCLCRIWGGRKIEFDDEEEEEQRIAYSGPTLMQFGSNRYRVREFKSPNSRSIEAKYADDDLDFDEKQMEQLDILETEAKSAKLR